MKQVVIMALSWAPAALLNDSFRRAMQAPETVRRLEQDALDVIGSTPDQLASTLACGVKKWATVIKERGMQAE